MYTYKDTCIDTHIDTCIYTYIDTHIDTHIDTRTPVSILAQAVFIQAPRIDPVPCYINST